MDEEIKNVLRANFPEPTEVEISIEKATGQYNGRLVWDGFKGMSFLERQKRVFDVLRNAFGPKATQISMIFTYTPSEYEQLVAA
jgi:acid stress-induced BolA-like protein IbaG/YrbA